LEQWSACDLKFTFLVIWNVIKGAWIIVLMMFPLNVLVHCLAFGMSTMLEQQRAALGEFHAALGEMRMRLEEFHAALGEIRLILRGEKATSLSTRLNSSQMDRTIQSGSSKSKQHFALLALSVSFNALESMKLTLQRIVDLALTS
jgi:hypothetical protein